MESFDKIFESFQSISKDEWKKKVEADLKGKSADSLDWKDEDEILHRAYYDKSDIESPIDSQLLRKDSEAWGISQSYFLDQWKPAELKKHLNQAYENGLGVAVLRGNHFDESLWNELNDQWKEEGILKYLVEGGPLKSVIEEKVGILVDPIGNMVRNRQQDQASLDELNAYFKSQLMEFNNQRFLMVEGSIFAQMGASAVQEVAYTLWHYTEYFDILTEAGQTVDAIGRSIIVNTSIGSSYFIQIAKIRALRINLQKINKYYGSSEKLNIWAESNPYYMDSSNFNNNLIRLSCQAMSAILGGADNIGLQAVGNSLEKKEFAARMCRNVQLILKHESHLDKVDDLIKGAYYIENITEELVNKSWEAFKKLESSGSILSNLEKPSFLSDIQKMESKRLDGFRNGKKTLVGVNKYQAEELNTKAEAAKSSYFKSIDQKLKG